MTALEAAKERLAIPDIWRLLGLPGEPKPGKNCSAPFRKDSGPSFSISADGRHFKDFGGEGRRGDQVDFLELTGRSKSDAARFLIELAGIGGTEGRRVPDRPKKDCPGKEKKAEGKALSLLPDLSPGTAEELEELRALRRLPNSAGLKLLSDRGLLWFTRHQGRRCWLVTDAARRAAQVRRMDGGLWGGQCKATNLEGTQASWPLGAADLKGRDFVLLTEGFPDALASATAAVWEHKNTDSIGFACMLGASNAIHPAALPHFSGKHVCIYCHNDEGGRKALDRWVNQLIEAGAREVESWQYDEDCPGFKEKADLNDFITFNGLERERLTPEAKEPPVPEGYCPECWANNTAYLVDSEFPCRHKKAASQSQRNSPTWDNVRALTEIYN